MKIAIEITETKTGNIEVGIQALRARVTQREAAYADAIREVLQYAIPLITQKLGGTGCVDLYANNPKNS